MNRVVGYLKFSTLTVMLSFSSSDELFCLTFMQISFIHEKYLFAMSANLISTVVT